MNFRVRRQGTELGIFSLEELRQRREGGDFDGREYVQLEGKPDWQPMDLVLQQGYRTTPPPLPASVSPKPLNPYLIVGIILVVLAFCAGMATFVVLGVRRGLMAVEQSQTRNLSQPRPVAVAAASKPVVWTTNTLTAADAQKRTRDFRLREWLDGYNKRGARNPASDAEAIQFLRVWIARNYGGPEATNTLSFEAESDKLANNPDCTDPLVLTVAADESLNYYDAVHRFERALAAYPNSRHKAYPKFYAAVKLAGHLGQNSDRAGELQTSALQLLPQCFADGSFTPGDQQEIAEIFVSGWGNSFFEGNGASVCAIVEKAGPDYQWLALTLDGEREINDAWKARGTGWSDSVTERGWQGFHKHLKSANEALTQAWNLRPDFPLAPCRMMTVALGDSDINEMRLWFDRTVAAQIDYPGAWKEMRWGLRPRWYGNEASMLALGRIAIDTGRFDTDVPYKFMDCLSDVESEADLAAGRHLYGRADIWPDLKRMYDGYVAAPAQAQKRDSWRSAYAVVAYFAGQYDTARAQLEALDWKPLPEKMSGQDADLSMMPLEVAARTGPLGKKISEAEAALNAGNITGALKDYSALKTDADADAQTRDFVRHRLSELSAEQRLQKGEWVNLLPSGDNDPDWVVGFGKPRVLPDGALEVESGPKGHMLFSRVRAGMNFEVHGQFELVRSSNTNFQGGLVMGVPDFDGYNWYGFRLKRHGEEGDVVCFGRGWSRTQITQHLVLNNVTNAFDFIFQNGKITASVNGVKVFHEADPPAVIGVPGNSYLLGLGAFNDSANTVIRYRDVQMRKL